MLRKIYGMYIINANVKVTFICPLKINIYANIKYTVYVLYKIYVMYK